MPETLIPAGFCQCGCHAKTQIAQRTYGTVGIKKGEPYRFLKGHASRIQNMRRENHPRWKGGRFVRNGYVRALQPDHPLANREGYVPEHRLRAEKALGKLLPAGVIVHHINEITTDNRNTNLVICREDYHRLLHMRMRALKACGNPNWRKCIYCQKHDDPTVMAPLGYSMVHLACRRQYDKKRHGE